MTNVKFYFWGVTIDLASMCALPALQSFELATAPCKAWPQQLLLEVHVGVLLMSSEPFTQLSES